MGQPLTLCVLRPFRALADAVPKGLRRRVPQTFARLTAAPQ